MFSIRSLIYILIVIGTAIACNDITPEKEQLPDDVLTLKVSAEKISLSLAEMEETAITLSWEIATVTVWLPWVVVAAVTLVSTGAV